MKWFSSAHELAKVIATNGHKSATLWLDLDCGRRRFGYGDLDKKCDPRTMIKISEATVYRLAELD